MPKLLIKSFRNKEARYLTNEEYQERIDHKRAASEFLNSKNLYFSSENEGFPLFSTAKHYGDYVRRELHAKVVSDSIGKIDDILMTLPSFSHRDYKGKTVEPLEERHYRTLIRLLTGTHPQRHFTILCHVNQVETIKGWFREFSVPEDKFSIAVSLWNYSLWAQDAYIALNDDSGKAILCEGIHFPRVDDATIAEDVATQTNKCSLQSHLFFEGGNILDAGDYALVGKDYIIENLGRPYLENEDKIVRAFEKLLGKEVIVVGRKDFIDLEHRKHLGGGFFQPIFHIDMYITPTGKKAKSGKYILVVGSPKAAREACGETEHLHDLDIYFDETAGQLSDFFEIVRIPLYPAFFAYKRYGNEVANQYYLSYNNALVENFDGQSHVYLPTFSQDVVEYQEHPDTIFYKGTLEERKKLDAAATKVWEELGFTVHHMDGLEDLALSWGSVHCITKVLRRG